MFSKYCLANTCLASASNSFSKTVKASSVFFKSCVALFFASLAKDLHSCKRGSSHALINLNVLRYCVILIGSDESIPGTRIKYLEKSLSCGFKILIS